GRGPSIGICPNRRPALYPCAEKSPEILLRFVSGRFTIAPAYRSDVPMEKMPMSSEAGSVTAWIGQLQAGDSCAAQQLWERYFRQLVELARKRFQGVLGPVADEEDVALSAFASFC